MSIVGKTVTFFEQTTAFTCIDARSERWSIVISRFRKACHRPSFVWDDPSVSPRGKNVQNRCTFQAKIEDTTGCASQFVYGYITLNMYKHFSKIL